MLYYYASTRRITYSYLNHDRRLTAIFVSRFLIDLQLANRKAVDSTDSQLTGSGVFTSVQFNRFAGSIRSVVTPDAMEDPDSYLYDGDDGAHGGSTTIVDSANEPLQPTTLEMMAVVDLPWSGRMDEPPAV